MSKPVVASYCTTFLKPEMLHVYRQVTGLRRYETFVLTKERRCEDRYPFAAVEQLPHRPRRNFISRFYLKHIRKLPPLYYRNEVAGLVDALKRRDADLMHVYFGHTGVHLLPFIEGWRRPCVVSFHGADVILREDRPEYAANMRALFGAVPLVLARSHSLAARLEEIGCPKEKIRLNRTGLPLADFPYAQRLMPADGEWVLVQSCRLIPKKGLRTAFRAFQTFRQRYPKARFIVAGEGPMQAELEQLAAELGIAEAVSFAGFLDAAKLNALYAQAHLFLHPSEMMEDFNQEGIPNAMLEAMATGLPVAATLHGGIPEAVENERSGLLVPERSPEALADALLRMVESSEYLQVMGQQASQSVRDEFEHGSAIARLEDAYDEARALWAPLATTAV